MDKRVIVCRILEVHGSIQRMPTTILSRIFVIPFTVYEYKL